MSDDSTVPSLGEDATEDVTFHPSYAAELFKTIGPQSLAWFLRQPKNVRDAIRAGLQNREVNVGQESDGSIVLGGELDNSGSWELPPEHEEDLVLKEILERTPKHCPGDGSCGPHCGGSAHGLTTIDRLLLALEERGVQMPSPVEVYEALSEGKGMPISEEELRAEVGDDALVDYYFATGSLVKFGRLVMSDDVAEWCDAQGIDLRSNSRLRTAHDRRNRPPMEWTIEDLVPARGVGQTFGDSGVGKTFVMADLAMRIANGMPEWQGREIRKHGPVVVVLMEGAIGFQQRLDAWIEKYGGTDDNVFTLEDAELDLRSRESVKRLEADILHAGVDPVMIVVDTQSLATAGSEENSNTEMTEVMARCKYLSATFDCAIPLLHHTGHNDQHRSRGASAIKAALDFQFRIDENVIHVVKVKEAESDYALGGWELAAATNGSAVVQPRTLAGGARDFERRVRQAVDVVEAEPGVTRTNLRSRLGGNTTSAGQAIDTAVERELLLEEQDGRTKRYYLGSD